MINKREISAEDKDFLKMTPCRFNKIEDLLSALNKIKRAFDKSVTKDPEGKPSVVPENGNRVN